MGYDTEGLVVDLAVSHDADPPKPGSRVRILEPNNNRRHAWHGKTGVIVSESEAQSLSAFKDEVYVKFDPPIGFVVTCPFHPSEFEVIE